MTEVNTLITKKILIKADLYKKLTAIGILTSKESDKNKKKTESELLGLAVENLYKTAKNAGELNTLL
jgi:hypothetical protein